MHCLSLIWTVNNILFFRNDDIVKIPKTVYKRLLDDSVKLYKLKMTIEKLNSIIKQKTDEIRKLKQRAKDKNHKSDVRNTTISN